MCRVCVCGVGVDMDQVPVRAIIVLSLLSLFMCKFLWAREMKGWRGLREGYGLVVRVCVGVREFDQVSISVSISNFFHSQTPFFTPFRIFFFNTFLRVFVFSFFSCF